MEHLLTCDCGVQHAISRSQAGQQIQCECGQPLQIPTLRGLSQLPVAGEQVQTAVAKQAVWSGWRGPAIAIASAVFVIAGLASARFGMQYLSVDTTFTEESAIELGNEVLEGYGPLDLNIVWNEYAAKGMGPKQRPDFFLWNKYAGERRILATIAISIAGGFGLIALAIGFTAPRKKS